MLYDPSTNTWTFTGGLNQFRAVHTLTRLLNGQVLAAGIIQELERHLHHSG